MYVCVCVCDHNTEKIAHHSEIFIRVIEQFLVQFTTELLICEVFILTERPFFIVHTVNITKIAIKSLLESFKPS